MGAERCPKPFVENGDHVWVSIPASNALASRPLLVCCHCREMRDGIDHRVIKPGEQPAAAPEAPVTERSTAPDSPMDEFEAADDINRRWE